MTLTAIFANFNKFANYVTRIFDCFILIVTIFNAGENKSSFSKLFVS